MSPSPEQRFAEAKARCDAAGHTMLVTTLCAACAVEMLRAAWAPRCVACGGILTPPTMCTDCASTTDR